MSHRKLLIFLSLFNAVTNTVYLMRFVGVLPPEGVVYGYVPWFMSFALPNTVFTLLSWLLVFTLIKKFDIIATLAGLMIVGGLIFHALNGFMFVFYTGSLSGLTILNAAYEVVVYVYGLTLATFYITQFWKFIAGNIKSSGLQGGKLQ